MFPPPPNVFTIPPYLNEEVNSTDPSPSVRLPCLFSGALYNQWHKNVLFQFFCPILHSSKWYLMRYLE
jgi:hypothetical protein